MISLDDFIKKYDGKGIDFDGAYGNQCMDLMHFYCVEVLGISDGKVLAAPTAAQVFSNFEGVKGFQMFDKVVNTPDGVPSKGDIMFWNTTVGSAGHVAVFVDGDANSFRSFDQNWPVGSKCHIEKHTYKGVAGWLRKKEVPMADQVTISATSFSSLVQKSTQWDTTADSLGIDRNDQGGGKKVVTIVNDLKSNIANLNQSVGSITENLNNANKEIERLNNLPPKEVIKEVIREVPVEVEKTIEVYVGKPKTTAQLWQAVRYYFDSKFGGGDNNE